MSRSHASPGALAMVAACRALYAAIDRLDQRAAEQVGVSRNDLRALNALEEGPVRAGYLAEHLGLTTGATSSLIDRLERRGLAERTRDPADRRVVLVAPTRAMYAELGPLYGGVARKIAQLADGYSEEELQSALRHLGDVVGTYESAADA